MVVQRFVFDNWVTLEMPFNIFSKAECGWLAYWGLILLMLRLILVLVSGKID